MVLASPIVALHLEAVLLAYLGVFHVFVPNASGGNLVYLLGEVFYLFLPGFDADEDLFMIVELAGELGFFYVAVISAVAECHVFLGAVSSDAAWYGVLDVVCGTCANEV